MFEGASTLKFSVYGFCEKRYSYIDQSFLEFLIF